ncbi:MAG: hypothetical protein LBP76_12485 [Treponema sp.]|jgi:hypothetical protein|nr:hypothetical protein [Treponema sp.]
MKKVEKSSVLFACLMVLGLVLVSCGGGKSAFVGRWYLLEGSGSSIPKDIELLKDGTGLALEQAITWKTEKDRFYIMHPMLAMAFNYKLSGSRLELTGDEGKRFVYFNKLGGDSALLGTWKIVPGDGETAPSFEYIFTKDGTIDLVFGETETLGSAKWVAENDVLYARGGGDYFRDFMATFDQQRVKYKIEGSTLTLTSLNDDGGPESAVFKKK